MMLLPVMRWALGAVLLAFVLLAGCSGGGELPAVDPLVRVTVVVPAPGVYARADGHSFPYFHPGADSYSRANGDAYGGSYAYVYPGAYVKADGDAGSSADSYGCAYGRIRGAGNSGPHG